MCAMSGPRGSPRKWFPLMFVIGTQSHWLPKADTDPNLENRDYRWRGFSSRCEPGLDLWIYVELRCVRSDHDYIGACSRSRAMSSPNPEKVI
jgi:hypothetical protein